MDTALCNTHLVFYSVLLKKQVPCGKTLYARAARNERHDIPIGITVCKLFLRGSSNRASVCARAAAYALVSVDNVNAVALRDATGGASVSTSTASDAIFRNLKCHCNKPP